MGHAGRRATEAPQHVAFDMASTTWHLRGPRLGRGPFHIEYGDDAVVKPEWGVKRICHHCGARFYDLHRTPILCPKCATPYDPEQLLKSRRSRSSAVSDAAQRAARKTAAGEAAAAAAASPAAAELDDTVADEAVDEDAAEFEAEDTDAEETEDAEVFEDDDDGDDVLLEDAAELGDDDGVDIDVDSDDDDSR